MRTPEQTLAALDEIEQRAKAATPGPWFVKSTGHGMSKLTPVGIVLGDTDSIEWLAADYEFIAAARTDIPDLIAAVRELQAERDAPSMTPTQWESECTLAQFSDLRAMRRLSDRGVP